MHPCGLVSSQVPWLGIEPRPMRILAAHYTARPWLPGHAWDRGRGRSFQSADIHTRRSVTFIPNARFLRGDISDPFLFASHHLTQEQLSQEEETCPFWRLVVLLRY